MVPSPGEKGYLPLQLHGGAGRLAAQLDIDQLRQHRRAALGGKIDIELEDDGHYVTCFSLRPSTDAAFFRRLPDQTPR